MDSINQKTNNRAFFSRAQRYIAYALLSINHTIIFLIVGLRPLLGPAVCRYEVSCGHYAIAQLREKSLLIALWAISKRLLSCNPFI